jgi:hypothetical protein
VSDHSCSIPPVSDRAISAHYNKASSISNAPHIFLPLDLSAPRNAAYLSLKAVHYRYVIRQGHRYTTSTSGAQGASLNSSLVKARINNTWLYGEITSIFKHHQLGHSPTLFVEMSWFDTLYEIPLVHNVWANL